ncbi:MAG: bifunctional phosphoribosyl-AMP cyclohydrolase/phosphoribosyl-ATP diphosphatase HisIE [Clostridiales bacterium]|jgi:phosphoribosyl-ATP pyrophosphohydrolase/phosphoribosyl-AMP cyclohydrolase|nr:bifunctional phosphoribosyl-AMP cyclohydrolase/phosphoribosyl-ATP diphosphatase HisIE [Clostridiales bacterium]
MIDLKELKYGSDGLIPAIAQDAATKEVLMLGYMNDHSLKQTLETGKMCYYSRSRQKLWVKGETSGHYQYVVNAKYDCDMDTLLFTVNQKGVACHTGEYSCFYRSLTGEDSAARRFGVSEAGAAKESSSPEKKASHVTASPEELGERLPHEALYDTFAVIKDRQINPVTGSYTNYLFEKGLDKILKKVGEETAEVIIASKNRDNSEIIYETADLMYHLSVLLANSEITWNEIFAELKKRYKK